MQYFSQYFGAEKHEIMIIFPGNRSLLLLISPVQSSCERRRRGRGRPIHMRSSDYRGVFLKKYFWENLAAVLRRTTNFPGDLWENRGAVLMRTNVKNMWCFLKWVLLRTIVKFS